MKTPLKVYLFVIICCFTFAGRASALSELGKFDHHGDHHFGNGGNGGRGPHGHGVAPEPVSPILFLFGAGVLALSYNQRRKLQSA
jgi:hypothetical protein